QEVEIENNALRIKRAELEREAIIKEKEAEVAGEKARVVFEQEVEAERIELQKKRLSADVIEPARAKKEAMELEAKGDAAKIIENGLANVNILNQMITAYKTAEGDGEKVFILNMLPEIINQLVGTVGKLNIDKISVVDSGSGKTVGGLMGQLPNAVINLNEIIENATGVNILSNFKKEELRGATEKIEKLTRDDV
ncbi:MAG: flotillin, partial [Bacteroidota bacterium]|nr:flotillin [Bacteroidota bacterium]